MTTPTREELLSMAKEAGPELRRVIENNDIDADLERFSSLLSAHQAQGEQAPFGYFHELLNHEGKGNGVWLGSRSKSVTEQSYIEGEVSKEIVPLYTAPPSPAQTDQVWNEALEAVSRKIEERRLEIKNDPSRKNGMFESRQIACSLKRPLQAQEPRHSDGMNDAVLRGIAAGIGADEYMRSDVLASPAAQSGAVDDPIALALDALKANHQHHQDYDEHDGYPESELCEQNTKAIAALSRVQTAPAVDLASVSDEREEVEPSPEILSSLDKVLSRPSAPAPVSEQPAAQTAGAPDFSEEAWEAKKAELSKQYPSIAGDYKVFHVAVITESGCDPSEGEFSVHISKLVHGLVSDDDLQHISDAIWDEIRNLNLPEEGVTDVLVYESGEREDVFWSKYYRIAAHPQAAQAKGGDK